jgi:flagellar hook protein FlgE
MGSLNGALFTGLSGLVVNQAELNVVGNNIANANTTAFKSSQVLFSPQFYATESAGSPSNGTFGGSDPSQIGLGAQVASVQANFSQGELQATGVNSDLGIDGNGFFIVKNSASQQLYTRNGAFTLNDQNQLVDSSGDLVMGYGVNSSFQIVPGKLQPLTVPLGQQTIAQATQNASLTGTLNAGGAIATNASVLTTQALQDGSGSGPTVTGSSLLINLQDFGGSTNIYTSGDVLTLNSEQDGRSLPAQTFQVTNTSTVSDLENFLTGGMGVDTAPPAGTPGPTPGASIIDATGGGQSLVITGNVGVENGLSIPTGGLTNQNGNSALQFADTGGATGEGSNSSINAFDSLGNPITINVNTVLVGQSATGTTWEYYVSSPDNVGSTPFMGAGTLTFGTTGQLTGVTGNTVTINRSGTGATTSQQINLDFSGVQALATGIPSNVVSEAQDGYPIGTLDTYAIGQDGTITGTFSNGLTQTVGQVALANFNNPAGLTNEGNNLYSAGADSGAAIVTTAGAQGTGIIQAGELEQSNVDISQEFINLIIASTGYSASSRVISTSDQLLTELLNSNR